MDSVGIDEREAISSVVSSNKLRLVYRPETHSMAEIKAAIEAAAASGESIELGPGNFTLNIDLPNGTRGFSLKGAGRNKTFIIGTQAGVPALSAKGMWFSTFDGFSIACAAGNTTTPVVDIDGKTTSPTLGVQGNTFSNLLINARGAYDGVRGNVGFYMCRLATNSGQGSENTFLNCHFSGAAFACYAQVGYNALNNTFVGGNFQDYTKYGMYVVAGSFHMFSVGFQSVADIAQITNDGWDIWAGGGGVGDGLCLYGCRSESLRFFYGNAAQPVDMRSCNQRIAIITWTANTAYAVNQTVMHLNKLYKCIANHTSGSTFEVGSNWEWVPFNVVESIAGSVRNCNFQGGKVAISQDTENFSQEVNTDYTVPSYVKTVMIHAGSGNRVVTLPDCNEFALGHEIKVIRTDNTNNTVNVYGPYFNNDTNVIYNGITLARRTAIYVVAGGGFESRRWFIVK